MNTAHRIFHRPLRPVLWSAILSILCGSITTTANAYDHGIVHFPAAGVYNGFNGHLNVAECTNFGQETGVIQLTLVRHTGAQVATTVRAIPPKGSTHIILNDLKDNQGVGIENDIGLYRLTRVDSAFDVKISCLTVFYRLLPGGGAPEYAFAVPVRDPLSGPSYGLYNSFDPSGITGVPTQNWLTILNSNTSQNFTATVTYYNQAG
ncbi:MAG: hypothetical protein KDD44_06595, partial [Bdellovibrionales bacterium]|nr:hypothetical protein [Bdellovibrionales bacterium]